MYIDTGCYYSTCSYWQLRVSLSVWQNQWSSFCKQKRFQCKHGESLIFISNQTVTWCYSEPKWWSKSVKASTLSGNLSGIKERAQFKCSYNCHNVPCVINSPTITKLCFKTRVTYGKSGKAKWFDWPKICSLSLITLPKAGLVCPCQDLVGKMTQFPVIRWVSSQAVDRSYG